MDIQETRRHRLRWLVEERYGTLKALATDAGKSQSQLSGTLLGTKGFGERLARSIESALGLPTGWLDESTEPYKVVDSTPPELVAVRRVRFHANAGILGWSVEMQEEDAPPLFFRKEWFQRRHLSPEQLLGVKVRGSSMEPGLFDGDTVVVNRAENRAINGQVFAVNYEGECVIKRLKRDAGEWWLTSDNADKSRYPDQRVGDGVSLIGRVIYKSSERV